MDGILLWFDGLWPWAHVALVVIGSLVVAGQAYVMITPKQEDDAWFSKIESLPIVGDLLKAITKFAVIQRK